VGTVWVDAGYRTTVIERGAAHGIDVQVVPKAPGQKGFQPLPKRWAIERTNGWIMLHRRLVRDYETSPEHSRAHIHWAMIDNMSRRLTHETTLSWRDDQPETGTPTLI
ncbi:transposase, partial [Micromonospora sp. PPF5-17]